MWVEKIIIEKLEENLQMSSLIIQDKRGRCILISERPAHNRVPFRIVSDANDFNIYVFQ